MADIRPHLERNLVQAEALGQTERAKKLKARLAELEKPEKPKAASKAPAKKKASVKKKKG